MFVVRGPSSLRKSANGFGNKKDKLNSFGFTIVKVRPEVF